MRTLWFIVAVFAGLVLMAIALILDLRRTKEKEDELIARQDKAMAKVRDDPNEPARWV